MNRTEKEQEIQQLRQDLENVKSAFLVDFRGMKVVDATELRRQVRNSQGILKVVKNTLALRAASDLPLKVLANYFNGPTAIAYTKDDPVNLAKILNTVSKDNPSLVVKAGFLEGSVIDGIQIQEVANLPSKTVLRGLVVGLVASPLRRLVWVLNGTIQKFLLVLSEIKKSQPESSGGEMNSEEIIKSIEEMSVLQLSQLIKALEDKFGVSAAMAAPVAMAGGGAGAGAAEAEKKEEKASFDVILASFPPDKKINIIKVVREVTSLGLKEAKELVEGAPKPLKEGVSKEEAETIKKKFAESGATVEVK